MRSVYRRILVWCLATLAVSMLAFIAVSSYMAYRAGGVGPTGPQVDAMIFEQAILAYESGGAQELAARLKQLNKYIGGTRYLTDGAGRDLATGENRSSLFSQIGPDWNGATFSHGHVFVGYRSPDDRYRLLAVLPMPYGILPYIMFYVIILLAVGIVCWALAISIASPLRNLARVVDRFGRGDLSVRVNSQRRDEIGALGNAFDQMAERIETLLTSERRLLQDISHELCSPLARLSFAVELLKRDTGDASVPRLKREIDRLSGLVSSLLEMARAEADPSNGTMEEICLDAVLREVVEDCGVEAGARRCRVDFEGNKNVRILGNRELLRRAFENIIRNAIRYSPEGSSVDVNLRSSGTEATILVRDYGPGVPDDLLSKIFQPFFRADDARSDSTGGFGLGLAIARRAIEVHHGRLVAANVDPGLEIQVDLALTAAHSIAQGIP
jgi:signal transduction histidine kinase